MNDTIQTSKENALALGQVEDDQQKEILTRLREGRIIVLSGEHVRVRIMIFILVSNGQMRKSVSLKMKGAHLLYLIA